MRHVAPPVRSGAPGTPSTARVVLLDLDKTLVNVEDHVDYCAAVEEARRVAGRGSEVEVPEAPWGRCALEAMRLLVALWEDRERWERASEAIEGYELRGATASHPMPGLDVFLEALGERPRAVVTLLGPRAAAAVLGRHRIGADAVVAREVALRIKPYPDQVLEALRRLGADPREALMVGDSEWDGLAARAAGVSFLGLRWGREHHGFGEGPVARDLVEAAEMLRPTLGSPGA